MMFRYKSHKQAFIMTALVILLCLVCLTGSTLALFTSDPTDGTIGIITTSGDVGVDIVDLSGASLQNKALAFMTTSGATNSGKVLFEPGATFYTQGFRIKNTGNIPIKFRLSICDDDVIDINGKPVSMEEFNDIFEVWISTDPTDPTKAESLKPFTGTLQPQEGKNLSEIYYLFIRMKDTVGNDFQGKIYTGIGITVYAVQGNVDINKME